VIVVYVWYVPAIATEISISGQQEMICINLRVETERLESDAV
jgi:hypothetical protein